MKVKYIAHACFLIETSTGTRILTDPYEPGSYDGAVKYLPVTDEADIVLVSHDHADHNWVAGVSGDPIVVREAGDRTVNDVQITGVHSYHDTSLGSERGENIIYRIFTEGLTVCHLGDLGHLLDDEAVASLRPVDVLLLPVGGTFAIDAKVAGQVRDALSPSLTIPMHFKTDGVDFPISPVDDYLADLQDVTRAGSSEVEFSADDIPSGTVLLEPSALP
ncbi:MBL fold metallo-hydrolase [bacterium]|nr:MAG: MBL fold metallo-hydrolase [bacterium]